MKNINLLPWREERLMFKNRIFGAMAACCISVALVIVFAINTLYGAMVKSERKSIDILKSEIRIVDRQIREIKDLQDNKKTVLERMSVIQNLQSDRPMNVKILESIVKALPNGVYLTNIVRKENRLTLIGESESNARVSAFLRSLARNDWLVDANIVQMKSAGEFGGSESSKLVNVGFDIEIWLKTSNN